MIEYHVRFFIAPGSSELIKPSFRPHNPVEKLSWFTNSTFRIFYNTQKQLLEISTELYFEYCILKKGPVDNSTSFFNIIVFDKHCPCNEFYMSVHHLEIYLK